MGHIAATDGMAVTDDLGVASYWALRGLEFVDCDAHASRARYRFRDPGGRADVLAHDFFCGEFAGLMTHRKQLQHVLRYAKGTTARCATLAECETAWVARRCDDPPPGGPPTQECEA